MIRDVQTLNSVLAKTIQAEPILDVHTHVYDPAFGDILLWNIDELITYHYLIAETFRWIDRPFASFFRMSKREQADLVWKTLFIDHSPCSEATLGVLTVLERLGIDPSGRDLNQIRRWFDGQTRESYIDKVFEVSGVRRVIMTNDPFDPAEAPVWHTDFHRDERFTAALRIDPLLVFWDRAVPELNRQGYKIDAQTPDFEEIRRFLRDWALRIKAAYMAVSLPDTLYAEGSLTDRIVRACVLPVCAELDIPYAPMIGVRRAVNPELGLAGDGVGQADLRVLESLCRDFPKTKFLATLLSRENQHTLTVMARKFRNLHIFGCWWFLNNPTFVREMTSMRFELLGLSFTPQHSDARVLDQLIYKWRHSKRVITEVMQDKYRLMLDTGWAISEEEIARDVHLLFGGAFETFLEKKLS